MTDKMGEHDCEHKNAARYLGEQKDEAMRVVNELDMQIAKLQSDNNVLFMLILVLYILQEMGLIGQLNHVQIK